MIKLDDLFNPSSKVYYPGRFLALFFLGLMLYYQVFSFGFVFDDSAFIVNNFCIRHFQDVHYMWTILPKSRLVGIYSFAFNYFLEHFNPRGYHIFNFCIHYATTLLVWALARMLFKLASSANEREREASAFLIALLFLVHPCQTQAVAYISQRFESMATFLYIGAMTCYFQGRFIAMGLSRLLWFGAGVLLFIVGIFTKETIITLPLMIFAAEAIFFNKIFDLKPLVFIRKYLLVIILSVIFFIIFERIVLRGPMMPYIFHFQAPSDSHDGDTITGGNYVLTQMRVFLTFMRLLILPVHQNLDYDYAVSKNLLAPPLTLVGLGVMGVFIGAMIRLRRRYPLIAFGFAWILVTFSINMAPRINVIFEHKLYLISFGFFLVLVGGLTEFIKNRQFVMLFLGVLIVVFSAVTYMRNQVWKNGITLWENVVQESPRKPRAYINLSKAYLDQGRLAEALTSVNKAIALNAYIAEDYNIRGSIFTKENHWKEAYEDFTKAIFLDSKNSLAYYNRGLVLEQQGKLNDALVEYTISILLHTKDPWAYTKRGSIYAKKGRLGLALEDYTQAIAMSTDDPDVYIARGAVYMRQGNFLKAMDDFKKSLEIDPNNSVAYNNIGVLYGKLGQLNPAIAVFNQALKINPTYKDALNNRSFAYSLLRKLS